MNGQRKTEICKIDIIAVVALFSALTFSASAQSMSPHLDAPFVWSSQHRQLHAFNETPRGLSSDLVRALDMRSSRDILICEPQVSKFDSSVVTPPRALIELWMYPDTIGFGGTVAEVQYPDPY